MEKAVIEYILECNKKHSLEYKWYCRNLDASKLRDDDLKRIIQAISLSSFDYYKNNVHSINLDKSLSIICNICNCDNTALTTTCVDYSVQELGEYFNEIARSGRKVKMCYDCGTVARAIFMNLIHGYRGPLSEKEKARIAKLYNPHRDTPLNVLIEFYSIITSMRGHSIFIISIGLDDFGHVWTIEKTTDDAGKVKYLMYQSSLNSYLLMDYIEHKDLARKKHGISIDEFFNDMMYLFQTKHWKEKERILFSKWFQFLPTSYVTEVKSFLFCWASLDKCEE